MPTVYNINFISYHRCSTLSTVKTGQYLINIEVNTNFNYLVTNVNDSNKIMVLFLVNVFKKNLQQNLSQ